MLCLSVLCWNYVRTRTRTRGPCFMKAHSGQEAEFQKPVMQQCNGSSRHTLERSRCSAVGVWATGRIGLKRHRIELVACCCLLLAAANPHYSVQAGKRAARTLCTVRYRRPCLLAINLLPNQALAPTLLGHAEHDRLKFHLLSPPTSLQQYTLGYRDPLRRGAARAWSLRSRVLLL